MKQFEVVVAELNVRAAKHLLFTCGHTRQLRRACHN